MKSYKQVEASKRGGRWRGDGCAGFIGEKHEDRPYRYHGPTVHVYRDNDTFVYVSTDDYEGTAMFRRENLPDVIAMLREMQREFSGVGESSDPPTGEKS